MKDYILEVCAENVESVLAAERAGATRIELCGNLIIGGTTPSTALFTEIRKYSKIRIHAIIRPRFGDFCYTDHEWEIMKREAAAFRELGAEGVVIGMLTPEGALDVRRMRGLMAEAEGMSVTLHRAFDVCRDPFEALEAAVDLGIDTILTSGQEDVCTDGAALLAELQERSAGRIVIQAGAGVGAEAIRALYPKTGIRAWHMSGKETYDSAMKYRRPNVHMGLPSFSEYELTRTSEEKVRAAREVLESL